MRTSVREGWRWLGCSLLALVFLFSALKVWLRPGARAGGPADASAVVIRFAHTHLQPGVREAFAALARDYERSRPGVVVEQIAVPERLYPAWVRTKLSGGLAPDLVQVRNLSSEQIFRQLVPLSEFVDLPNPYNVGTALAERPWRETFFSGLAAELASSANLMNVFGIPYAVATTRMVYNRALLRRITGRDEPPQTWAEFQELCAQVQAYARVYQRTLVPLAASSASVTSLINLAYGAQTQRLALDVLSQPHRLEAFNSDWWVGYLGGRWDFSTPAVRSGLKLAREIMQAAQPGFLQAAPADAHFYFLQEHALMVAASSSDLPGLREQASFELGVFRLPLPTRDDPVYGAHVLGPVNESIQEGLITLGLTRTSAHPEVALDFLRYLTSLSVAQRFADLSGWLPAVTQIIPNADLAPFMVMESGYLSGRSLGGGADTHQAYRSALHRLVAPDGGVEAFIEQLTPSFGPAVKSDLRRMLRTILKNSMLYDAVFGALWEIEHAGSPRPEEGQIRLSEISESQNFQEEAIYLRQYEWAQERARSRQR